MANSQLDLPKFRMRGENMTRIETFVAAAFAFAVTMLVISLGSIPSTFDAFILAVKQIPSFATSCAIIFWIWHSHANWCRRYGLEDGVTVVLSGLLIFLVLIYIYPLRLMMQGMFSAFSGGYFPVELKFTDISQVRFMFGFYATGFLMLCGNFIALYLHARRRAQMLELTDPEIHDTNTDIVLWCATALISSLSLLGSFVLPNKWLEFCGYSYFLLFPVLSFLGFYRESQRARLAATNLSQSAD